GGYAQDVAAAGSGGNDDGGLRQEPSGVARERGAGGVALMPFERKQDVLNINWRSPGPVASRFMASGARIQILNGPVGSGKTTACFMKAVWLASQQAVSVCRTVDLGDGVARAVRKFKLATIRDTYRSLWKTTIPSWFKRFPAEAGEWNGAVDAPA